MTAVKEQMRAGGTIIYWLLLLFSCTSGFTARAPLSSRVGVRSSSGVLVLRLTPEEERATLLAAYIRKANEDKMKAVRAVEEMKDAEIAALKEQLRVATSQSPSDPESGKNLEALSRDELIRIVKSYQQLMPQFTVQLKKQTATATAVATQPASNGMLYNIRNARVVAAAAAGKSRWGSLEVDRAVFLTERAKPADKRVNGAPAPKVAEVALGFNSSGASSEKFQMRNARLAAASRAGKSRWGDMEVKRIQSVEGIGSVIDKPQANGSMDASAPMVMGEVPVNPNYQLRNARVVAAAKAGKARWGEMEVKRIQNLGGMPLALEQPNSFGASSSSSPTVFSTVHVNSNYQLRNARVVAAAKAGKARWGEMEVKRIQNLGGMPLAADLPKANGAAVSIALPPVLTEIPINSNYQLRNARVVAAAKAGKARWGEMEVKRIQNLGGMSLALEQPNAFGASSSASPPTVLSTVHVNSNYQLRNARVVAAARAGKSRWGEMEVKRIQSLRIMPLAADLPKANGAAVSLPPPPLLTETPINSNYQLRNSRLVAAAKAGKARWGEMEVKRIQNLVGTPLASDLLKATLSPPVLAEVSVNSNYQLRNARVVAAAKAGKARWGDMEVKRIQRLGGAPFNAEQPKSNGAAVGTSPLPVLAEGGGNPNYQLRNARVVAAANARKSRWGEMEVLRIQMPGAGMPQSAQNSTTKTNHSTHASTVNERFHLRNVRLFEAAKAGKSRWGEMEVRRIQEALSLSGSIQAEPPASNHGLSTVSVNVNFHLRNARLVEAARAGKSRWGEMEVRRAQESISV